MALEPITRQEQIIAGKSLEPITRMERFLKDYGVSNYFGETTVMGDTLTWDGNTEGLTDIGGMFFKVSDVVLSKSDFANGFTTIFNGEVCELSSESVFELAGGAITTEGGVTSIPIGAVGVNLDGEGMTATESGTYFMKADGMICTSLTIPGYNGFETKTIKRLDEKYMPILTSPNGTKFRLAVNDDGTVTTAEVAE